MKAHYWYDGDQLFQKSVDVQWKTPPVYEVIRLIDGIPLFFNEHMARLKHSIQLVALGVDVNDHTLFKKIHKLVELNQVKDQNIRIELGRDSEGIIRLLLFFVDSFYPSASLVNQGVDTIVSNIERENPHAKVVRLSYVETIRQLKETSGCYEVILSDMNGKLTEGSRSNLFFIKGTTIYSAHAKDVLMGITRDKIIMCIKSLGLDYVERDIYKAEIDTFEGAFISGTSINILPIRLIDEHVLKSASNHAVTALNVEYNKLMQSDLNHTRRLYL